MNTPYEGYVYLDLDSSGITLLGIVDGKYVHIQELSNSHLEKLIDIGIDKGLANSSLIHMNLCTERDKRNYLNFHKDIDSEFTRFDILDLE